MEEMKIPEVVLKAVRSLRGCAGARTSAYAKATADMPCGGQSGEFAALVTALQKGKNMECGDAIAALYSARSAGGG